jgi:signal transduction histidine kinase
MIDSIAFRTRARTIDHLGREQIADCPTAVSELWKNAYDAYARNVVLSIHDGAPVIATIADDGHGMSREEFTDRWLVVGTESKAGESETPKEDRNGLSIRTKQGQKGIGRLSSANLGPLLLLVSKRRSQPFVASLVDWRLFENPYLYLTDIRIPIVEFEEKEELLALLPDLFEELMANLWGEKGGEPKRNLRVDEAWKRFSASETASAMPETTLSRIEKTVIETAFEEVHLSDWAVWKGESDHGTILMVSDVQFDLAAQLTRHGGGIDSAVRQARQQLFQTLSNFTDPFLDERERTSTYGTTDFATRVTVFEGGLRRNVVDEGHPFDVKALLDLEHVVDGVVDEYGKFRGRVKAFGEWLPEEVTIAPAIDVSLRDESRVGPFHLRLGTFEQDLASTSASIEVFRTLEEQATLYAGFMVYRNGLRVLPYGREGSDFFRIESRRSKNAGREFWSLRRLFGRVALRIEDNPNLRDKAGREGLIDNKAAKTFRDLVEHILRTTALNHFGSSSDLRKQVIPERRDEYKKQKVEEERNKQRAQTRKRFRANLERSSVALSALKVDVEKLANTLRVSNPSTEGEIVALRTVLQDSKLRLRETSVGEAPRNLGSLEDEYLAFRKDSRATKELLDSLADSLDAALEQVKPRSARDLAYSQLSSNAAFLQRRLRSWSQEVRNLLESERIRVATLLNDRNKAYHAKMMPVVEGVQAASIPLRLALEQLDAERELEDEQNSELFEPYISALNSLKESIDLAGLANFSQEQADELREEVDRLHGLAQLGITVEIVGHEMEALEQTMAEGLKAFPDSVRASRAFAMVRDSHEALVDRLRFLSPLKLSGQRTRADLTGTLIFEYVRNFFADMFKEEGISIEATPAFLSFSIFEQPARIYPVFINLVNNAAYWASHSKTAPKRIIFDAINERVVVADSGPGVDAEDQKRLFQLFFTRKIRGGRGVGLYLCRANLSAGGHSIEYHDGPEWTGLPGAAFVIDFKGAKYD